MKQATDKESQMNDPAKAKLAKRYAAHADRFAAEGNERMAQHYRTRIADLRRLDNAKAHSIPANVRL
jgi:hypothetical protein